MGLLSLLFSLVGSASNNRKARDHSRGRTFAPYPKRKNPNSRRSSRFGPRKG